MTFDTNLRYRKDELKLEKGDHGKVMLENRYIMEVKVLDTLPLWFVNILNDLEIRPASYSKYGEIFKKEEIDNYV